MKGLTLVELLVAMVVPPNDEAQDAKLGEQVCAQLTDLLYFSHDEFPDHFARYEKRLSVSQQSFLRQPAEKLLRLWGACRAE